MATVIESVVTEIVETAMEAVDLTMNDFSVSDFVELLEDVSNNVDSDNDFVINLSSGDVRIIHSDDIDQIQQDEIGDDLYILGCFNASFLSGILDIDQDVIEDMQKAEAFEAIGKLVISIGKLAELQQEYAAADGYGHHFAHYDHEEHVAGDYYIFRTN